MCRTCLSQKHRTLVLAVSPSGEGASQPLPSSLEIPLAFVVEPNQEAKGEGERSLEWATSGKGMGGSDEKGEKETE